MLRRPRNRRYPVKPGANENLLVNCDLTWVFKRHAVEFRFVRCFYAFPFQIRTAFGAVKADGLIAHTVAAIRGAQPAKLGRRYLAEDREGSTEKLLAVCAVADKGMGTL